MKHGNSHENREYLHTNIVIVASFSLFLSLILLARFLGFVPIQKIILLPTHEHMGSPFSLSHYIPAVVCKWLYLPTSLVSTLTVNCISHNLVIWLRSRPRFKLLLHTAWNYPDEVYVYVFAMLCTSAIRAFKRTIIKHGNLKVWSIFSYIFLVDSHYIVVWVKYSEL